MAHPAPTGREVLVDPDRMLISKTDPRGVISYANAAFVSLAGYERSELVGSAHSVVRHPDMPRGVFRYMWEVLATGKDVFAFVVNLTKTGDHYWVFAHVKPDVDPATGELRGYFSSRRSAPTSAVASCQTLYAEVRKVEAQHSSKPEAAAAGQAKLLEILSGRGQSYEAFVIALNSESDAAYVARGSDPWPAQLVLRPELAVRLRACRVEFQDLPRQSEFALL